MQATARRFRPAFFFALALSIICSAPVRAKTSTIDDSGTQALEPAVSMRWKTATPGRARADNFMVGTTTIRARLNVLPWLHRSGRIYLNLPAQQPGPFTANWTTQGRFLPGQVQSGNRALLYSGPITAPVMEEVMSFQFNMNAALLGRPFPISLRFEIDEG